jgi:hypothetical protein
MDLDFDINTPFALAGRRHKEVTCETVRPLTSADLDLLSVERGVQKPIPLVQRVTARHRQLAKCLGDGLKDWEAAAATGYSLSRITALKQDPSFRDLVEFYRTVKDEQYVDMHKKAAAFGIDLLDSMHDDLEDGKLSPGLKADLLKSMMDRTGYGPAQTVNSKHTVTVDIAGRVQRGRERLEKHSTMIDITPEAEKDDAA